MAKKRKQKTKIVRQNRLWMTFTDMAGWRTLFLGLLACLIFIIFILATQTNWGERLNQSSQSALTNTTASFGLRVRDVTVSGRYYTDPNALQSALQITPGMPLVSLDLDQSLQKLSALHWVKEARIERQYPDLINVVLQERTPTALWQKPGGLVLIDEEGEEIIDNPGQEFSKLLIVHGEQAPKNATSLLKYLEGVPSLSPMIVKALYYDDRRWILTTDKNILVHLPENDIALALTRLERAHQDKNLLDQPLKEIDLRISDRFVLKPLSGDKTKDIVDQN